jgi:hypothetical protein
MNVCCMPASLRTVPVRVGNASALGRPALVAAYPNTQLAPLRRLRPACAGPDDKPSTPEKAPEAITLPEAVAAAAAAKAKAPLMQQTEYTALETSNAPAWKVPCLALGHLSQGPPALCLLLLYPVTARAAWHGSPLLSSTTAPCIHACMHIHHPESFLNIQPECSSLQMPAAAPRCTALAHITTRSISCASPSHTSPALALPGRKARAHPGSGAAGPGHQLPGACPRWHHRQCLDPHLHLCGHRDWSGPGAAAHW